MNYKKYFSEYEELKDTPIESKIQNKVKRSLRRKHKERKKKYSEAIYGTPKLGDHMKNCSCILCGNPRKYFKEKTIQEKRVNDKLYDEISEG